jgi:hypothetical protein
MGSHRYPTTEGLWSRGRRAEPGFSRVKLGFPYKEAVKNFQRAIEGREDFDPTVLFVWGTMQATAVLNILRAVEEAFGERGQEVVRKAIRAAGYEAMEQMLENSEFPEDIPDMERLSYIITGINTVLYASLERPWIISHERCEFDILWCPHQDRYSAFDCRVQRYFVEGMIEAVEERTGRRFTARVEELIPRGAPFCHFVVEKLKDELQRNPWHTYSDELGKRAFQKMKEGK